MKRVLIDECLPTALHRLLSSQNAKTVAFMGWRGKSDGDLLDRAETAFDVFLTADRGLRHQQNLTGRSLAIVVVSTERLTRLAGAVRELNDAINRSREGEVIVLSIA